MKFWTALVACLLLVASIEAHAARRMGGGGSMGRQSGNVTQREAARPASPANPTPANTAPANNAAPAAPAAKQYPVWSNVNSRNPIKNGYKIGSQAPQIAYCKNIMMQRRVFTNDIGATVAFMPWNIATFTLHSPNARTPQDPSSDRWR